jgi:hypothetical protein
MHVQPRLARACAAWCAITVGIAVGPGTVLMHNGVVWLYPVAVSLSLAATLAYAGMFACDLPQQVRALRWYSRLPRGRRTW